MICTLQVHWSIVTHLQLQSFKIVFLLALCAALCPRVEEDLLQLVKGMFVTTDVLHCTTYSRNNRQQAVWLKRNNILCKSKLPPMSHFSSPTWTHASSQNISSASSQYYICMLLFKWNLSVDLLIINHLNTCVVYKSHCEILSEIQDIIIIVSHWLCVQSVSFSIVQEACFTDSSKQRRSYSEVHS